MGGLCSWSEDERRTEAVPGDRIAVVHNDGPKNEFQVNKRDGTAPPEQAKSDAFSSSAAPSAVAVASPVESDFDKMIAELQLTNDGVKVHSLIQTL